MADPTKTNVPATNSAVQERPKPISLKVREAIASMVSGDCRNITAAAEKVGIARETLSRALNRPHVTEYMHQKVRRHLATASARAGATKVDLLDSQNEMVRDRASSFVLGLAGIAPAAQPGINVNLNVSAGYIVDLTEPGDERPMKVVSP